MTTVSEMINSDEIAPENVYTRNRPAGALWRRRAFPNLDFVTSRFPCLSATLGPQEGVTDSEYALVELKFHSSYVSHDGV